MANMDVHCPILTNNQMFKINQVLFIFMKMNKNLNIILYKLFYMFLYYNILRMFYAERRKINTRYQTP